MKAKTYHPMVILLELSKLARNAVFFGFLLFVIQREATSLWVKYGRIAFFVVLIISICSIFLRWLTSKYEINDHSFHLYKGIFTKSKQTVPFSKIHNVSRHTTFFHKMFRLTSIRFETSTTEEDTDVIFKVITYDEADVLEKIASTQSIEDTEVTDNDDSEGILNRSEQRKVHFSPTKKELMRAAFTSFSFIFFIPVIASIYTKVDDMFHIEREAEGLVSTILDSWLLMLIVFVIFIACSIIFGIIRTYLKYGKYEISSDQERIYIKRGVLEEATFSILKEKVQAIEVKQTLLKRILGLAEVKLTSVGSFSIGEEKLNSNSLYPFLPVKRAYSLITELLPTYTVAEQMKHLPKKSLWVKLFKPSWIWLLATAALFYFKPILLDIKFTWAFSSALLLLFIVTIRILDYYHTAYILNDEFVQFKSGSLTTTLFISKRSKIIEVEVIRNPIQKYLGLATIGTANRANPIHYTNINDVPIEVGKTFYQWYLNRRVEVEIDKNHT
ncbi:PH domain-containing protein [Metabacillus malikii]|uniref:Membrane protein n=1 Tax=Metabacillus malikii TaxID=1504265 RepID=A0ABT9ZCH5_9BACI|nr:PH domain-containing protein [Metabacillus malikii]MDQ0228965.1 putative membrane protein [Metabacillus malikii]